MGGFITTAARLCRSSIRPLVLPPPGSPDTPIKRIYDVLGTIVSIIVLNFAAAPFMLLNIKDSLMVWQRLEWYGIWMVGGALVFFYAGGRRVLMKIQARQQRKTSTGDGSPEKTGASTPTSVSETFQLPPSLDQVVPPLQ
jgi:lysophospholipid acyltransferase